MKKFKLLSLLAIAGLLVSAACGDGRKSGRPVVAVTEAPLAWAAAALAGDSADIITLLPAGADPETYEPTVNQLAALGRADALFMLGTPGFEAQTVRTVSSNFPDLNLEKVTEGIKRIHDRAHANATETGNKPGSLIEEGDPHITASARNMRVIVANMARALAERYPERRKLIMHRADSLEALLDTLDFHLARTFDKAPNRKFVMTHPSLGYLSRDYGLTMVPLMQEGREPTPREYMQSLQEAQGAAIFVAEQVHDPSRAAEAARMLGIPMVMVNLNSEDWREQLTTVAGEMTRQR